MYKLVSLIVLLSIAIAISGGGASNLPFDGKDFGIYRKGDLCKAVPLLYSSCHKTLKVLVIVHGIKYPTTRVRSYCCYSQYSPSR